MEKFGDGDFQHNGVRGKTLLRTRQGVLLTTRAICSDILYEHLCGLRAILLVPFVIP